jgi:arginyl-tRNA synthetase
LYRHLEARLTQHFREYLRRAYDLDFPKIVVELPPRVELGEYALPLAFELAKKLRKAPKKIAEEIVAGVGVIEGFTKLEVAGAGYINAYVDRAAMAKSLALDVHPENKAPAGKILVEHSSINPNKAAHIGHLRNAILGDTFVRLLRFAQREVDVQNYIDNTGAQVADVVVGFQSLDKKSHAEIEALTKQPRFDYYCWDLYARVSQWYAEDHTKERLKIRAQALHDIEHGGNETADLADLISVAVLRRHLETMDRLDIEYDFLPRESEILHLHFWDAAFTKLKESGALTYEDSGKNKGCWVMQRVGTSKALTAEDAESAEEKQEDILKPIEPREGVDVRSKAKSETEIAEQNQKVIVRSNGTVGYVGKDIAYHMWKFGLLGKDFGYRKFYRYPNQHECWISAEHGEPDHPHFGGVAEIYNVIDARQSEAQNTVIEALRALGHNDAADHYTHFSYEMVALTPRCAAELGYMLSDEDKTRAYIEVSGRKGFGVKADDLIDRLIASAKVEVDARHPEISDSQRVTISEQIAVGALRYFMLRFTKNSVIAFDFKEALSFEGETGPYAQYAAVRAANIFRKSGQNLQNFAKMHRAQDFSRYFNSDNPNDSNDIWDLLLTASRTSNVVAQCIATTEPAHLAKHAFQLAQKFNSFYHHYPILQEADEGRQNFLLSTVAVVHRELTRVLAVMGIQVPEAM